MQEFDSGGNSSFNRLEHAHQPGPTGQTHLHRVLAQLGRHALDGAGGIGESSVGSNRTGQARACHRIKQERVHS